MIMSNFDRAEWPPAQMNVVRLDENAGKILPPTVFFLLLCFAPLLDCFPVGVWRRGGGGGS